MKNYRNRSTITCLLILALVCPLPQRKARAADPQVSVGAACIVLVIGIGLYVTWELYKVCKRMNERDNPKDPPATNNVNKADAIITTPLKLTDASVGYWDCSASGLADPYTGSLITGHLKGQLQSSADLLSWNEEYSFEGWASADGVMFLWTKAGVPAMTNYCVSFGTNAVPLNLVHSAPAKFYRITTP